MPLDHPEVALYKPIQVAQRLNVCENTVFSLIRTGRLKSVKIGRARRIPVTAVNEYLSNIGAA